MIAARDTSGVKTVLTFEQKYRRVENTVLVARVLIKLICIGQMLQLVYNGLIVRIPGSNSIRIADTLGVWLFGAMVGTVATILVFALFVPVARFRMAGGFAYGGMCMVCAWKAWSPDAALMFGLCYPLLGALLVAFSKIGDERDR